RWGRCVTRRVRSDAVCARAGPLPVRARHPEDRQRPHDPTGCGGTHPNIPEGESTHVAVKIRLNRMGKIRAPFYRIVVADSRKKSDGAVLEQIRKYHPTENPSLIEIQSERALYWLGVGAQPSEQVAALLKVTGDWAKFKGEGDVAGSMKGAEAKKSAEELIADADKAAAESREGAK